MEMGLYASSKTVYTIFNSVAMMAIPLKIYTGIYIYIEPKYVQSGLLTSDGFFLNN